MAVSEDDFRRIREHRGDRKLGFEELCCQLASLESSPEGSIFMRKGPGVDQGLECWRRFPTGVEFGWQAKHFIDGFSRTQVRNLDESLDRALAGHPALARFIVCLPVNLSDNRGKDNRKKSELQLFDEWARRREAQTTAAGRPLHIELWGATVLGERLSRDDPRYSGRLRYWFDTTRLTKAWFSEKLEASIANLGQRYTPKSHVPLPIESALQSLARDEELLRLPSVWAVRIAGAMQQARKVLESDGLAHLLPVFESGVGALLDELEASYPDMEAVPTRTWRELAKKASACVGEALKGLKDSEDDKARECKRKLFALYAAVDNVNTQIDEQHLALASSRLLLVTGKAGMGKSHLIADFARTQVSQNRPVVLTLAVHMNTREPWLQIREALDLQDISTAEFLGALDAAGQAHGCRAIVAVDALNEGVGLSLWRNRIPGFLKAAIKFPHIAIVLTVRDTYLRHFESELKGISRIKHEGFAGHAREAVKAYLDQRGVAWPSSPSVLKEFENPLFLRTCCDYLDRTRSNELPKGVEGTTALFDFYIASVTSKLEVDMELDETQGIPGRALRAFLHACTEDHAQGALLRADATSLFETYLPSGAQRRQSLLAQFLSEGILTQDLVLTGSGDQETVRFTFERLYDHLRAQRLLDEHVNVQDIKASFRRPPLASYVDPEATWQHASVVEALTMQLPERFGVELFDVAPREAIADDVLVELFMKSLAARKPAAFTVKTAHWLIRVSESHLNFSVYYGYLLVCAEPDNRFNADFLHEQLLTMERCARDATWSVFLATDDLDADGPTSSLISWAWDAHPHKVDRARLSLACTALAWHLTTSHRAVRDLATKALVNLLHKDLRLACKLIEKFAAVDDPYLIERVLAAAYGAQMQGADLLGCRALAQTIYDLYFASGKQPPLHLLARDACFGILECARHMRSLPAGVDLQACHAGLRSTWPIEAVNDAHLERYKAHGYRDSIGSSTSDDGDFGHYTVTRWLQDFSILPRELAGQNTKEVYGHWEQAFMEAASLDQVEALIALLWRALDYRQRTRVRFGHWDDDAKDDSKELEAALTQANQQFKSKLSSEQLVGYSAFPEYFLLESSRMYSDDITAPHIDPAPIRRWIDARAHELGWTAELFSSFEDSGLLSYERIGKHRMERVGKKYQHIALAEVAARVADNLALSVYGAEGQLEAFSYRPEQLSSTRDIDPSLLIRQTKETGWASTPVTWWTPTEFRLPVGNTSVLLAWLQVDNDFVNSWQEIDVTDTGGGKWLVLDSFRHWSAKGQRTRNHPDAWSRIACVATRVGMGKQLALELASKHRGDVTRLSEPDRIECFLGEHGWRSPIAELNPRHSRSTGIRTPHVGLISTLTCESLSSDNSIDDDFTLHLPSAGLIQLLGLRLRNGRAPEFADQSDVTRIKDPSVVERGPGAALISRDFFIERLAGAGLEPVWVLAGEKNVYGPSSPASAFGGCVMHTTAFYLSEGKLTATETYREELRPSAEQLRALWDAES
jgi:hypothetical protein